MIKKMEILTKENINDKMIIENIDNPEWGTWRILRHYSSDAWEIRGNRGDRILDAGCADQWHIIKRV